MATLPSITDDSAEHLQHLFYELFNRALHGRTRAYIPAIDDLFKQHAATLATNPELAQQWVLYRERLLQFPPLTGYDI